MRNVRVAGNLSTPGFSQTFGGAATGRPGCGGAGGAAGGHRHVRHRWCGLIEAAAACGQIAGQADAKGMGWFSRGTEAGMATLTTEERKLFDKLDEKVTLGVRAAKVVSDAGKALATIRDRQLYRDVVPTWEEYLERHGLTRRRADQMVAAANTLDAVQQAVSSKTGTVVPELSERAIRPLVGLAPESAAEAVIEAAASPEGITPASVRKAAAKRKSKAKVVRVPRPVRFRVPGAVIEVAFNAKGAAGGFDVAAALEAALESARRQSSEAA
jgi:hypothetical protein